MQTDIYNGDKGEAGITPNITIGTVTTLEAGQQATVTRQGTNENPIFNFGIPKGESANNSSSGSNNFSIDDNIISTEKTWSSFKIEEFVLNNVGAIWQEINGGQMVIDSTMDGFLREVEILGNTIQNQDDLSDIQHLGVWNEEKQGYEIEIVVSNSSSKDDLNYQEFRTTIVLPCQISKVGDFADRLYWDKNKGRYVVEKNISDKFKITSRHNFGVDTGYSNMHYIEFFGRNVIPGMVQNIYVANIGLIATIKTSVHKQSIGDIDTVGIGWGNNDFRLYVNKAIVNDKKEAANYFNSFNPYIYYPLQTSQLIETDIREEIKLPTFMNITYVTVNGGIQGTIKAKAPVDGGKVIGVLQDENIKLKEINEVQDKLINTTMLATDEMYMMLEPLLVNMFNVSKSINPLVNMYVAMINRGLKTMEHVPERYREQVKKIIE